MLELILPDTLCKCNLVYLLFSEILKRSTTANCLLINNVVSTVSQACSDDIEYSTWTVERSIVSTVSRAHSDVIIVKLKKVKLLPYLQKLLTFSFFSSIDQVIKQLFHLWFGNSQTAVPRCRGYCLFSACMAAVKCRPVLHHCVVIFWSSGIMECTCTLFTFENGVLLMRYGASVVWHHSLPLMNSFDKTETAVF